MLPSSRRPKEVDEERAQRLAADKAEREKEKLVFRTSKVEIFRKTMADWFNSLTDKEKRRLTPLILKRKAVQVCFNIDMIYDRLPLDWVTEMKTKYGMVLHDRKKEEDSCEKTVASTSGQTSRGRSTKRRISAERGESSRRSASSTRHSSSPKSGLSTSTSNDIQSSSETTAVPARRSIKQFLDYSNVPPPPFWLQKYAEGIVLPRMLSVYSTEDTNILFYDYDPKLKDDLGRIIKPEPQPRSNLNMIENFLIETQEDVDEKRRLKRLRKRK